MSTDQPLVGYSVYRTNYGGGRIGDTVLWTDKGAAEFMLDFYRANGEAQGEPKMSRLEYTVLENGMALSGRTVYELCDITRRELVRRAVVDKLNEEELEALGLLEDKPITNEATDSPMVCYAVFDVGTPVAYGRTMIATWQAAANLMDQKIKELRGMGWELKEGSGRSGRQSLFVLNE